MNASLCECGHSLADHTKDSPHGPCCDVCKCARFRPKPSRPLLPLAFAKRADKVKQEWERLGLFDVHVQMNTQRIVITPMFSALEMERDRYRIEADCAMRDYDALELDAGIMRDALAKIARTVGIVTRTSDGVALRTAPEYTGQGAHDIAAAALQELRVQT